MGRTYEVRAKRRRTKPKRVKGGRLIDVPLPAGLPDPEDIEDELDSMVAVLTGQVEPPIQRGIHTLQEVSVAFYARAQELTMLIQRGERDGSIAKGSSYYQLRTGEIRTFVELAKRAADLGSRRLTAAQLRSEQKLDSSEADALED